MRSFQRELRVGIVKRQVPDEACRYVIVESKVQNKYSTPMAVRGMLPRGRMGFVQSLRQLVVTAYEVELLW
jgi:hypothetical protein